MKITITGTNKEVIKLMKAVLKPFDPKEAEEYTSASAIGFDMGDEAEDEDCETWSEEPYGKK